MLLLGFLGLGGLLLHPGQDIYHLTAAISAAARADPMAQVFSAAFGAGHQGQSRERVMTPAIAGVRSGMSHPYYHSDLEYNLKPQKAQDLVTS